MVKSKNLLDKRWKIVALYATVTFAVFGGFFYWVTWSGSTDNIRSVADQFKAPSSWVLEGESITPPANVCFVGPCPAMGRTWKTDKIIDSETLRKILAESSWTNVKLRDSDCIKEGEEISFADACSAHGRVGEYDVAITTIFDDPVLNTTTLTLHLR